MLKNLNISNIILVESANIPFKAGFNVLSGETGSGKSAIMSALNQLTGVRADSKIIRQHAEKGSIEATFDIDSLPKVKALLEESGIDHVDREELIIRREITAAGKSRSFINNQSAQLTLLKKLGGFLLDIIGQHANQTLLTTDYHRQVIDLFGGLREEVSNFEKNWLEESKLRNKLEKLISSEAQRMRETEVCEAELEEIDEAQVRDGEEEEVFAEYTRLSNAEELAGNSHQVIEALSQILPSLKREEGTLETLHELDPSIEDTLKAYRSSLLEMEEISHTLRNYNARVEFNPAKLQQTNERLTLINKIKRKYGPSYEQIQEYREQAAEKLKNLTNCDQEIEELKEKLALIESQNDQLAAHLTESRKKAAAAFESAIVEQLRALNMPKVEFFVVITSQKRNRLGDDILEFYLMPNVGERKIPIRECASGGELSRLMLALQTLLAGKEELPTLIFDEIDANIGGKTATVVGEKLEQIGGKHQVICITHFPQVAKCAHHHIQISKSEKEGRTVTEVVPLTEKTKTRELERMSGKC